MLQISDFKKIEIYISVAFLVTESAYQRLCKVQEISATKGRAYFLYFTSKQFLHVVSVSAHYFLNLFF